MEYSLIKHLKNLCENDLEYNCLYASWMTEKEVISEALSTINFNFPHFSLHDESHSMNIIKNIEMLLGEDRIKQLGATETWIILMTAYLHDVGMVILNDLLDEKWQEKEFQNYLINLSKSSKNKDLQEAAVYILNIQNIISNNGNKEIKYLNEKNWPIKTRNYLIQISSEYFRRNHAKRSNEYIKNSKDSMFNINKSGIILERLVRIIGDIALCHELSFEECLDFLKYKSNGIGTDKFHPRFVASLIRLGDLLDLDNGRFNVFFEKIIGRLPEISDNHRLKHSSITHFLIEPKTIEIEANCESEDVYRITREWTNWLIEEVKNLSSNWSKVVPGNFTGGPPTIENIKLFLNGQENVNEQVDLKFNISQEVAFELFEGLNIYDNELVFIREFIQNAMDSSKIQMWQDICKGHYDTILASNNNTCDNIKYINDIPKEIWNSYPIEIKISTDEQNEEFLIVSVIDKGCGFSKNNLVRLVKLGESWAYDKDYIAVFNSMPIWLKPTGAFGMGMQSAFMVTDEINIYTKTDIEGDKKISLVSGKDSGYVVVKDINESIKRRTKVFVKIKKDLCSRIIQKQRNIYNYDFFTFNNKDNKMMYSLLDMIKQMVTGNYFLIYIDIPEIENEPNVIKSNYHNKKTIKNYNEWIQYKFEIDDNGKIIFHIWENNFGSYIKLVPKFEVLNNSELGPYRGMNISFRGVALKNIDNHNPYFVIDWDLLGLETKNYLDISRKNIKKSNKEKLINFMNKDIIPIALEIIYSELQLKTQNEDVKDINEKDLFTLLLGYLIYCNGIDSQNLSSTVKHLSSKIPEQTCKTKDNQPIKLNEFLDIKSFLVYDREMLSANDELDILEKYKAENYEASLTKPLFFEKYLMKFFYIEKIYLNTSSDDTINIFKIIELSNTFIFLMRRKDDIDLPQQSIKTNEFDRKKIILSLKNEDQYLNYTRKLIYAIEPYASLAVNKIPENTYVNKLFYTDSFIISPFCILNKKYSDYDLENLISKSANMEDSFDFKFEEDVRKLLLFDELIDWVINHSANPKKVPSKEEITQAYLSLIKEYYYIKFALDDQSVKS